MSEQHSHQQNKNSKEEIEQQRIYKKGEINYEKFKICRQLCSDILRVRL
jgi:hypothetical protein